jgi:hypothetical protein
MFEFATNICSATLCADVDVVMMAVITTTNIGIVPSSPPPCRQA